MYFDQNSKHRHVCSLESLSFYQEQQQTLFLGLFRINTEKDAIFRPKRRGTGFPSQTPRPHPPISSNTQTNVNSGSVTTAPIPYLRGTSETIARILQPYNIRVAHKPIATLPRLLTNVKDQDNAQDRQDHGNEVALYPNAWVAFTLLG